MMRESPHLDPETYWRYIEALKTQKNISLSAFGFSTLSDPRNKKGKVDSFRAVIPSINEKELLKSLKFEPSSSLNHVNNPQKPQILKKDTKTSLDSCSSIEPKIKYRYDFHGFRVPDDGTPLNPIRKIIPHEPPSMLTVGVGATFEGLIVQKTKKTIEHLIKENEKEEEEVKTIKWAPMHRPESTFPLKRGEEVLPKESVCVWSEFSTLSSGEVLVTIEHCAGCSNHDWITRHNESQYVSMAAVVESCLRETAAQFSVRFGVIIRSIEQLCDDNSNAGQTDCFHTGTQDKALRSISHKNILFVDTTSRIGALEVQVAARQGNQTVAHILHSKLFRGAWPRRKAIQRRLKYFLSSMGFDRGDGKSADGVTGEIQRVKSQDRDENPLTGAAMALRPVSAGAGTGLGSTTFNRPTSAKSKIPSGGASAPLTRRKQQDATSRQLEGIAVGDAKGEIAPQKQQQQQQPRVSSSDIDLIPSKIEDWNIECLEKFENADQTNQLLPSSSAISIRADKVSVTQMHSDRDSTLKSTTAVQSQPAIVNTVDASGSVGSLRVVVQQQSKGHQVSGAAEKPMLSTAAATLAAEPLKQKSNMSKPLISAHGQRSSSPLDSTKDFSTDNIVNFLFDASVDIGKADGVGNRSVFEEPSDDFGNEFAAFMARVRPEDLERAHALEAQYTTAGSSSSSSTFVPAAKQSDVTNKAALITPSNTNHVSRGQQQQKQQQAETTAMCAVVDVHESYGHFQNLGEGIPSAVQSAPSTSSQQITGLQHSSIPIDEAPTLTHTPTQVLNAAIAAPAAVTTPTKAAAVAGSAEGARAGGIGSAIGAEAKPTRAAATVAIAASPLNESQRYDDDEFFEIDEHGQVAISERGPQDDEVNFEDGDEEYPDDDGDSFAQQNVLDADFDEMLDKFAHES